MLPLSYITLALLIAVFCLVIPLPTVAVDPFWGNSFPTEGTIDILGIIGGLFTIIWPITVAVIILTFIYAGFLFLTAQGDPGKLQAGKSAALWGVAGVALIVLAFSMITIIRAFFNN